jgi:hypothetical protein
MSKFIEKCHSNLPAALPKGTLDASLVYYVLMSLKSKNRNGGQISRSRLGVEIYLEILSLSSNDTFEKIKKDKNGRIFSK